MSNQLIPIVLLSYSIGSIAWSQQPHITRTRHQRMILLASDTDKEGENKLFQDKTNEESSFGVSYIGGGKIRMFKFISFMVSYAYTSCVHLFMLIFTLYPKTLVDQSIMMIHLMLKIISNQGCQTI